MKPTLSEALRSLTMTPVECWDDPRLFVMHSAADALDAASGKPVFSDFDFKECTITPEEEKRVRQTGRYLSEHDHLEFWQLDGRVYVLNSRVNPKLTPAAPEKPACDATVSCLVPAPSSPAAERADEGLEEEARELFLASWPGDTDAINSWHSPHNAPGLQERWMNVARAARALRRGGVTDPNVANDILNCDECETAIDSGRCMKHGLVSWRALRDYVASRSDSGASVVVDREEWERTQRDLEQLRAFFRSVNDEIPEGLWPAATTLDAFRKLVDGYSNVCADAKALHEREDERDRALADTEHRHALAERERDALAAKLAEAERALCERAEQVDKLMQERDLVMARLGNFCQPGEIEDRIRILQGHAGKMERQRDEARADAERLRGERDALEELRQKMSADITAKQAELELIRSGTGIRMRLADFASAPPTVAVTDVERAAEEIAHESLNVHVHNGHSLGKTQALGILRKHTRAASVEEVAKAFHRGECDSDHSASEATGVPWENANQPLYRDGARNVLRALGVREAEKMGFDEPRRIALAHELGLFVHRNGGHSAGWYEHALRLIVNKHANAAERGVDPEPPYAPPPHRPSAPACKHERSTGSIDGSGGSSFRCLDCGFGYGSVVIPHGTPPPQPQPAQAKTGDREGLARAIERDHPCRGTPSECAAYRRGIDRALAHLGLGAQSGDTYTCVRCNAKRSEASDGSPYVYCHECAPIGQPPREPRRFVVDRNTLLGRMCLAATRVGAGDAVAMCDTAIAEIERQRAEHEKGGFALMDELRERHNVDGPDEARRALRGENEGKVST